MVVVVSGPSRPRAAVAVCADVDTVLATIRTLESAGDYTITASGASASGAYQIIDATWASWSARAGVGTKYHHAADAPAVVQDAVAADHVDDLLQRYNDVSVIPVAWYYPAAIGDDALMDAVPAQDAGNTLTPRQYQARWMQTYRSLGGSCG